MKNDIVRIALDANGYKSPHFSAQMAVYHNNGFPHVDSCKTDDEGNLYQAVMEGGRALVVNKFGIPIANILLSDRDDLSCIHSPNLALQPHSKVGYIISSGPKGAWIYKFSALAISSPLFSHKVES